MDDYNSLITLITTNPELALIPLALIIGKIVKESKVADEFIPIIVIVISTAIGFAIAGTDAVSAIKGFVAGLVAVGGVSGIKQLNKRASSKKAAAAKKSKLATPNDSGK